MDHFVVKSGYQELLFPQYVPDWDDETGIEVGAAFTIDLERCLQETGLSENSKLSLHLLWHATGSRLRGASEPHTIVHGNNHASLRFTGPELGGTLTVRCVVTLARAGQESHELAPSRPGSILWSRDLSVRLEGQGSRFPVSHVGFSSSGIASGLNGAWCLVFENDDLVDSGVGSVRLYLNTEHPSVERYLAEPQSGADFGPFIRNDVNRQLVLRALHQEELDIDEEYPRESLGELLSLAVRRNFPGRSLDEVRALSRERPGEFEAEIQARGGFLL
ncbi:hypothetical protein [Terrabacter sp. MAHUQ-38]|uniref:hypothetical protein n=1 Tax=unclassified Terrabacter TaxID=2630222 RepID=UPI00165EAA50|nr:hypothetical protein [Terrabacter sp. MAHUQ-38]MBC9819735.1 hypothetical protein [Terrabacter sp. MAHUQ-38]